MSLLTRKDGRKFVDSIRLKHGGIEASDREKTPETVLESLQGVREQLAGSVKLYYLPASLNLLILLTMSPVSPRNSIRHQQGLFLSSSRMLRTISTNAPMLKAEIHT